VGHRSLFVSQDNSPEIFFTADQKARQTYQQMIDVFGADEFVLVQLRGASLKQPRDVQAALELARKMALLPGVKHVFSIGRKPPKSTDKTVSMPAPQEIIRIQEQLEAIPLYRSIGLYQPNIPALGAVALVVMQGPQSRMILSKELTSISDSFAHKGYQPLVAGLATANAAIERIARQAMKTFLPLVVLICLLITLFLFRSLRAVIAMFLPVLGAVAIGIAGLEIANEPLNLITGVMPPLVMAVGVAGSIHLLTHYSSCCGGEKLEPRQAIIRTIKEKFVPTAFAFATTALGFGSLALSEVRTIQVLGISTAIALFAALLLITIGTPAFLIVLRPHLPSPPHRRRILEQMSIISLRWRWLVLTIGVLLIAFTAVGFMRIDARINGMDMLPAHTPERIAYQQLEREGLGLGNLDIWLHKKIPNNKTLLEDAHKIMLMAADLQKAPLITSTIGIHNLLKLANFRATGIAEIPDEIDLEIDTDSLMPSAVSSKQYKQFQKHLAFYFHREKGLKLTLLSITGDEKTVAAQKRMIRETAHRYFPNTPIDISGHYAMLIGSPGSLMRTLLYSLATTVIVVTILFIVAFRSFSLVFGGMIANLLPVAISVGIMGWFRIPLDVATVMTGSVAFGIAVDDTFHYLYHRKKSNSIQQAARIAGQGIVATSFVLTAGFSTLALSGFNPIIRFGLLTALATFTALIVDATLLPALIGKRTELTKQEEKNNCSDSNGFDSTEKYHLKSNG
jgi:hypothetical protein